MGELVKLAHPKLFNYRSNLAELCNDYSLKGIYLAPEELESLERADDTATHGLLANSFTVGVVMLALIMMKHQNDLYDYRGYRIDYTKLKETLALATPQYSRRFVNIIAKLLERKTADRLSIKEALNSLEDTVAIDNNDIVELMLLEQKPVEVEEERIYLPRLELPPQYPNFLAGIVHPKVTLNG